MRPLVKLITEWDAYENEHPGATPEEFCRYFLIRESKKQEELFGGSVPPDTNAVLAKLVGRLGAVALAYSKMAIKGKIDIEIEWYFFMNTIYHQKEARKTDVITYNVIEQSTGIDILNRLKKAGYISERDDPDDKRAKLVKLTPEGEAVVFRCWDELTKAAYLMFGDMNEEDKKLVIQLLGNSEIRNSRILAEYKNKTIEELLLLIRPQI
jgi:DNA-binding MarR family transcriptional regulator